MLQYLCLPTHPSRKIERARLAGSAVGAGGREVQTKKGERSIPVQEVPRPLPAERCGPWERAIPVNINIKSVAAVRIILGLLDPIQLPRKIPGGHGKIHANSYPLLHTYREGRTPSRKSSTPERCGKAVGSPPACISNARSAVYVYHLLSFVAIDNKSNPSNCPHSGLKSLDANTCTRHRSSKLETGKTKGLQICNRIKQT